jgi:sugar O-acyltransferase (sialic acid O-acetyltransferase NeuD family)
MDHVVRPRAHLSALRESGFPEFIVAIGNNTSRARCYETAIRCGYQAAAAVHPTAIVSPSAGIGSGTVLMPQSVVNAGAVIGVNCIINTGAVVEHDCAVGDHSHLAPGSKLGGGATVGSFTFVGMNASVLPLSRVGDRAIVGAGAVVLKAVSHDQTVAGVPARPIEKRSTNGRADREDVE